MKAIKKFFSQTTEFKPPENIAQNNPLNTFLDTLTKEQREGNFLDLNTSKQCDYVRAMADFQVTAMRTTDEATIKALTMLAIALHKQNIDSFELSQNFAGSKEGVDSEEFFIKLEKIKSFDDIVSKEQVGVEFADNDCIEPKKQNTSLLSQDESIIGLIEQIKEKMVVKPVNELPLRASGILLTAQFMSQTNIENFEATLEGLTDGDNDLHTSYRVKAIRKEIVYDLNHNIKHKMK